jgi:NhaP-type Na+/H+ or K+/H+ antiporter
MDRKRRVAFSVTANSAAAFVFTIAAISVLARSVKVFRVDAIIISLLVLELLGCVVGIVLLLRATRR